MSYNDTYDWSEDEPHNEALEIPPVVLTGTLLQLSTELRQKLSIPSSAESDSVGVFGLAKTVTEEKHMFGSEEEQKPSLLPVTQPATTATLRPKTALSKLVEFPGDPQRVAALLQDEGVALNGKDMYGITALMKFAAWNKVELLQMLLPRLTVQEVNATGGKQRLPLLHYCVDMDAWEALSLLLEDRRVDLGACDEHGRDYKEHAAHWGKLLSN